MSMLSRFISSVFAGFSSYVGNLFAESGRTAVGKAAEGLADIANEVVGELQKSDVLTNDEKREEAARRIKERAIAEGKEFSGHAINIAIELALAIVTSAATRLIIKSVGK